MPNWCENSITIKGPRSKLEEIVEKGKAGLLDYFYPMPEVMKKALQKPMLALQNNVEFQAVLKEETGYSSVFEWRVYCWHSKWDIKIGEQIFGHDGRGPPAVNECGNSSQYEAELKFNVATPQSPPLGAYKKYLENNKDVSIRALYYEPHEDNVGSFTDGDVRNFKESKIQDRNFEVYEECKEFDAAFSILESRKMERKEEAIYKAEEALKKCANCGNRKDNEFAQILLKLCSRCKAVKYCNVYCQKEDWKKHKRQCMNTSSNEEN